MKIKFIGGEISPGKVSIRALVEFLRALEKGLLEIAEEEVNKDSIKLSQLSLERLEGGSLSLVIDEPTSPGLVEDLAASVAKCLRNFRPRTSAANPRIINTLLGFNHRHGCRTQVFRRPSDPEPLIEFVEAASPAIADLIEEAPSLFGVLERVGGTEPRAWLRIETGDRIICRLPEDRILAQELAKHLYREVGLSGRAVRDLQTDEFVELFVEELSYAERPIMESFRELERKIGHYWSDVRNPRGAGRIWRLNRS